MAAEKKRLRERAQREETAMLSALNPRRILLGLMVAVLALGFGLAQPRDASAEIGGFLPASGQGGIALVVYSGGSLDEFQAELFGQGCGMTSTWVTVGGRFVGYFPSAPDFVNQGFLANYPGGVLPANHPLLVVCQQGGVGGPGPAPTSSLSNPAEGLYVCGPQGNEAIIQVLHWDEAYYPLITEGSGNEAFTEIRYRFPVGATEIYVKTVLRTGLGWPTGQEIEKVFGVSNPLDPSGFGAIPIGVYFPDINLAGEGFNPIAPVVDGNEHLIPWQQMRTIVPNRATFEAYAKGDLLHGQRPDVSSAQLAAGLGATNAHMLEQPPYVAFSFEMDGKLWRNTYEDLASCNYTQQ